jgi:prepilin-type N-terminal cleavage/methylation domain-containing protein
MSYKSLNQKGFTAIESVLVIVILAIIGGTGYYIYQANNKSTDTQNAAQTATASTTVASTTGKSAAAAGAQAKLVYANLLKDFNKNGAAHTNWDVTYVDSSAGSKAFTTDFKTAVDNGTAWSDGVFCTTSTTFDGFSVSKTSLGATTASVTLLPTTKGKSDANSTQIKLGLQYSKGNWLVDKHECVTP